MPSRFGLGINAFGGGQSRLEGYAEPTSGPKTGTYTVTDSGGNSATGNVHMHFKIHPMLGFQPIGKITGFVGEPIEVLIKPIEGTFLSSVYFEENGYNYHPLGFALYESGDEHGDFQRLTGTINQAVSGTISLHIHGYCDIHGPSCDIVTLNQIVDVAYEIVDRAPVTPPTPVPVITIADYYTVYEYAQVSIQPTSNVPLTNWRLTPSSSSGSFFADFSIDPNTGTITGTATHGTYSITAMQIQGDSADGQTATKNFGFYVTKPPVGALVGAVGAVRVSQGVSKNISFTIPNSNMWYPDEYALVFIRNADITVALSSYVYSDAALRAKNMAILRFKDSTAAPKAPTDMVISMNTATYEITVGYSVGDIQRGNPLFVEGGFDWGSNGRLIGGVGSNYVGVALVRYPKGALPQTY